MFYGALERDAVIQNLKDAGCSRAFIEAFMEIWETGSLEEQLRMLARRRRRVLDGVHAAQKKLDRLDYLRYQLENKEQIKEKDHE